ncbi:hypothetical protein [Treponema sp.]|uniref:hypothetical protein n=1 Tax=Treponema sp. TaxID=166 RepID=UPI00298D6C7D|nr:hypothetical protein [Treponema sp.]MCQ2242473.1 hypothetical protein [Treponema sp.]
MAQTIGMNFVLTGDNTQLKQTINETRALLGGPIASSNSGSPISASSANTNSSTGISESNASGFLSNSNTMEIQKGILEELRSLSTYFIRGNGNQVLRQSTQQQQAQSKTDADKMKETMKTVIGTAALAAVNGMIAYDTGSIRVKMAEYKGDYFGSEIAKNNRTAGAITAGTSFIPALTGIVGTIFGQPLVGVAIGKAIQGAVDSVVKTGTENKNVHIEEQQLLSESYKARLKLNDESLAMYGGDTITRNSARTNAGFSNAISAAFLGRSMGTGMELDEFQSLANQFSRYGVTDYYKAGDLARASALTQSFTGADATDFLGLQSRLGKNSTGAIASMNAAYSASLASGLGKGQFSEFLNGLQSAVEDGISNGFIRSTEDVSKTMVMFSKLSGNDPTLQGEYGFKMLRQMDNGLKNATNLSSTSHLMAFQALRGLNDGKQGVAHIEGQDALNTLAYMEGGLNQKNFGAISKRFKAQYGDDVMENVLAIKELYGLNYNGAMKVYEMQNRAAEGKIVTDDEIKSVMANSEFNSDQKNMVNYLNDIKYNTSILGEGAFRKYLEGLAGIDEKYSKNKEVYERVGVHSGVELNESAIDALSAYKSSASVPKLMQFSQIQAGLNDPRIAEEVARRLNEFNSYGEKSQMDAFLGNLAMVIENAMKNGFSAAELKTVFETGEY